MPILTLPIYPSSESWGFEANVRRFESDLDATVQTSSLSGGKWVADLSFNNMTKARAAQLKAFLMALEGGAGSFYLAPNLATPLGAASTSTQGLVNGASQVGGALITDGWSNSLLIFRAGDHFEVNGEFKIVTQDFTSSGAGAGTIYFKPNLRAAPPDNAEINFTDPVCVMRLREDSVLWSHAVSDTYTASFSCEEVL